MGCWHQSVGWTTESRETKDVTNNSSSSVELFFLREQVRPVCLNRFSRGNLEKSSPTPFVAMAPTHCRHEVDAQFCRFPFLGTRLQHDMTESLEFRCVRCHPCMGAVGTF